MIVYVMIVYMFVYISFVMCKVLCGYYFRLLFLRDEIEDFIYKVDEYFSIYGIDLSCISIFVIY